MIKRTVAPNGDCVEYPYGMRVVGGTEMDEEERKPLMTGQHRGRWAFITFVFFAFMFLMYWIFNRLGL